MRTFLLFCSLSMVACDAGNHLLSGEVEAQAGPFHIRVTDCYRTHVDAPVTQAGGTYRFTPCKDADVMIRQNELIVNGRSYGQIRPGSGVLVDHGVVSVQ